MRKLTFGMNLSLDGYIAAPGDDLGWSMPSDELFQWWSDRVAATGLALYGRRLWETMSSHWPTADQQPGATPAAIEFAGRDPGVSRRRGADQVRNQALSARRRIRCSSSCASIRRRPMSFMACEALNDHGRSDLPHH